MTETELIEEIAAATGDPKVVVARTIKSMKEVTRKTLDAGESVVLTGFGVFLVEKLKKWPLFGQPRGRGFWTKVKFNLSRRRPLHGEVRSSDR